ncbi:MAG TPA: hypothetical protein VH396_16280 [Chitinophagaceae bacterium]|jgi:hypothetical protein
MKKTIGLFSIIIISSALLHVNAQKGEWKLNLNYNYSLPLGSFKNDIISNNSPRGFSGDFMYGINDRFSAGLYGGYQDFYQKYSRDLYQTGNHEVTSAVLSNSIQTMPILAKGKFMPLGARHAPVQPYLSVGAGISIINFSQYLGEFGGTSTNAGFTAQGGAGVMIPFGRYSLSGLSLGADYNYIAFNRYGYNNLGNLGLHAGVYFPLR